MFPVLALGSLLLVEVSGLFVTVGAGLFRFHGECVVTQWDRGSSADVNMENVINCASKALCSFRRSVAAFCACLPKCAALCVSSAGKAASGLGFKACSSGERGGRLDSPARPQVVGRSHSLVRHRSECQGKRACIIRVTAVECARTHTQCHRAVLGLVRVEHACPKCSITNTCSLANM